MTGSVYSLLASSGCINKRSLFQDKGYTAKIWSCHVHTASIRLYELRRNFWQLAVCILFTVTLLPRRVKSSRSILHIRRWSHALCHPCHIWLHMSLWFLSTQEWEWFFMSTLAAQPIKRMLFFLLRCYSINQENTQISYFKDDV